MNINTQTYPHPHTHTLRIKILDGCPNRDFVEDYYRNHVNKTSYSRDCGVDLIFPDDRTLKAGSVTKCGLGIACELTTSGEEMSGPYDLVGRSSIIKTPLMLANGVGIMDPDYRGEVIAALRCTYDRDHPSTINQSHYEIKAGEKLVQVVAPDRRPIHVEVVESLSDTERGDRGFGSTNIQTPSQ